MPIPAITIRSYSTPLLSEHRHGNIANVLAKTNFKNADSVTIAHATITEMTMLDAFCDWAFHRGRKAEALDALATLMLYEQARKNQSDSSLIPGKPGGALAKLADLLSPRGEDALLQGIENNPTNNEFSEYLTAEDWPYLAGHVFFNQDRFAEAAVAYGQAAVAYTQAGLHERAAYANWNIGVSNCKTADAKSEVAGACMQNGEPAQAAAVYTTAADAYKAAADAYKAAADASVQAGQPMEAADAYKAAADAYKAAADAYKAVVGNWVQAADPDSAYSALGRTAEALDQAAEFYRHTGQITQADDIDMQAVEVRDIPTVSLIGPLRQSSTRDRSAANREGFS
ncbi:hypothetical protein [Paraburkholderia sediminicola]|uniref:hypothetical protein n=1 Tax=Paraburkholderia sediminicola TaxID=458836 RepID=UPI0038B9D734